MEKNHSSPPSGGGLELDKIDIPARSSLDTVRGVISNSERESAFSPDTASPRKRHFQLMLTAVISTLVLLAAMAVYLKKQDLTVSYVSGKNAAIPYSYLRVGPISATTIHNEIVQLSLDIECENNDVRKRLAEKDSRIRDKIVSVITAPDTHTLLKQRQYDAVKAKIKESLEKIGGEPIGEVYFAELLTY